MIAFGKKYSIILSDPPWHYNNANVGGSGKSGSSAVYDVMSTEDICEMPISYMSNEDCVLFMWATMPQLEDALRVIKAWGFTYKTCAFVWVKKNKKQNTPFFGMGSWSRSNAELCLLATKGKPKRMSASVSQIIWEPISEHSKKPDCVRDRIVELCGDLPRIELFARQRVTGWEAIGKELPEEIK